MFEKILLKQGNLNKAKYKIYLKRKRLKIKEINYYFENKLKIIFIYLRVKMRKIKNILIKLI